MTKSGDFVKRKHIFTYTHTYYDDYSTQGEKKQQPNKKYINIVCKHRARFVQVAL